MNVFLGLSIEFSQFSEQTLFITYNFRILLNAIVPTNQEKSKEKP